MLLRFIKRCFSLGWVVILSIQVKAYAQPQDISSTRLLHPYNRLRPVALFCILPPIRMMRIPDSSLIW